MADCLADTRVRSFETMHQFRGRTAPKFQMIPRVTKLLERFLIVIITHVKPN